MIAKIKSLSLYILLFTFYTSTIVAQNGVGINTVNPQAVLDVESTASGILIPRMTSAQRVAISSPPTASLVYQTDGAVGFYYYDGSVWRPLLSNAVASNGGWSLTGNTGTTAGTNFIGTTDGVDFVVKTNGSERMRALSTGNVGIGTTSPNSLLSVNGNIEIKGNPAGNRYLMIDENATGTTQLIVQAGAGSSGFGGAMNLFGHTHATKPGWVTAGISASAGTTGTSTEGRFTVNTQGLAGGVDLFTVLRSGNVGISTTSPKSMLDIGTQFNGTLSSNAFGSDVDFSIMHNAYTYNASAAIPGYKWVTTHGSFGSRGIVMSFSRGLLFFADGVASTADAIYTPTERMRITNAGNVGIGTTSPTVKTHVYDAIDGTFTGLAIDNRKTYGVGTGINELSRIVLSLSESATPDPLNRVMGYVNAGTESETNSANGFLALGTRTSGAETEKMRITGAGNVGIGTTAPTAKLEIDYNNSASNFVKMQGSGGATDGNFLLMQAADYSDNSPLVAFTTAHVTTTARNNNLVRIHSNETGTTGLPLRVTAQGSVAAPTYEALAVNYIGNIGIGRTTPESILDVFPASTAAYEKFGRVPWSLRIGELQAGQQFISLGVRKTAADNNYIAYTGNDATVNHLVMEMSYPNTNGGFNFLGQTNVADGTTLSAMTNIMHLDVGGNVGIGKTTPLSKLHINGTQLSAFTGTTRGILSIEGAYTNGYYAPIDFLYTNGANPTARIAAQSNSFGSKLMFGTSNSYASGITNTAMTIDHVGNVGIGTDPVVKLDVADVSSRWNGNYMRQDRTTGVSTSATAITTQADYGLSYVIGYDQSNSVNIFYDMVLHNNTSVTVVSSSGVGSNPTRTYSVSGNNLQVALSSGTYTVRVMTQAQ